MRTKAPEQAEKILVAAARLFATKRFHEARMEDIAAAAAVGKGTLYRYFQDKDELYQALLARAAEQISVRLHEELESAPGPRQKLEAIVRVILTYFDEQPHLFDLIHHAEAMHQIAPSSPWHSVRQENQRLVREVFDEARARGEFVVADPDVAMLMLLGGLRAVLRSSPPPRPPDLVSRIVDVILLGAARLTQRRPTPRAVVG